MNEPQVFGCGILALACGHHTAGLDASRTSHTAEIGGLPSWNDPCHSHDVTRRCRCV